MKKTIRRTGKKPSKERKIPEKQAEEDTSGLTNEERIAFQNGPPLQPPISSGDETLDEAFKAILKKRFRKN